MHVKYVDHYLNDAMVAHIARHSFDNFDKLFTEADNDKLIKFLARGMTSLEWEQLLVKIKSSKSMDEAREIASYIRNIPTHWVPFAHPHITLLVSSPVPIRTQCFKHKVGFVESEVSRRYITTAPELFIPEHIRKFAENKKQGSDGIHPDSEAIKGKFVDSSNRALNDYLRAIEDGVCPEQARMLLPQAAEVRWVWTGSLYAYANFYIQRSDPHAQKEIQKLAEEIGKIIAPLFPVSWSALTEGNY